MGVGVLVVKAGGVVSHVRVTAALSRANPPTRLRAASLSSTTTFCDPIYITMATPDLVTVLVEGTFEEQVGRFEGCGMYLALLCARY